MRTLALLLLTTTLSTQTSDWKAIKSWSGDGISETESFATTAREWRLRWTAKNTRTVPGTFSVSVHDAETDKLVSTATGLGSQESYVRGKGRFYLKINAALVAWTVSAEEPAQ
jgi:hypothetical protein